MTDQAIISQVIDHVKAKFSGEASGHDWFHLERVWKMAKHLAELEGQLSLTNVEAQTQPLDQFVLEAAALLHDIADWKFHDGDEQAGPAAATALLKPLGVSPDRIDHICDIISTISFKGAGVTTPMKTLEGQLVQDADRLDAIGAIGVARAFAYGGSQNRPMYDPDIKPHLHGSFADYKTNQNHSLNHFYEKLLLLKDRMNTASGKQVAEHRHQFLNEFLAEFLAEWDGLK
jgi:uncharacterized protein